MGFLQLLDNGYMLWALGFALSTFYAVGSVLAILYKALVAILVILRPFKHGKVIIKGEGTGDINPEGQGMQ